MTRKAQLSPYLRSKMGTASAVSPMLNGNLTTGELVMAPPCCLISLANEISLVNKSGSHCGALAITALALLEMIWES